MQKARGVENDLRELKSACKYYEGEVVKFPKEDLEGCESLRDDATEMLCDLAAIESKLELTQSRAKATRTDILRVLDRMDAAIEAKKKPAKKRKAAPKKPAPKAAAPPAKKKAKSADGKMTSGNKAGK